MRANSAPVQRVHIQTVEAWSVNLTSLSMLEEWSSLPQAITCWCRCHITFFLPEIISPDFCAGYGKSPDFLFLLAAAVMLQLRFGDVQCHKGNITPCADCAAPSAVIYLHYVCKHCTVVLGWYAGQSSLASPCGLSVAIFFFFLARGPKSQGRSLASVTQTGLKSQPSASNTRWQHSLFPGLFWPTPDLHSFFLVTSVNGYW